MIAGPILSMDITNHVRHPFAQPRAGARAVDLEGPTFEFKHKSHCFQRSKLVDWGEACRFGGPGPPLAPTLAQPLR